MAVLQTNAVPTTAVQTALLHTTKLTFALGNADGVPAIRYFGNRLSEHVRDMDIEMLSQDAIPQGGLDVAAQLTIASTLSDPTFLEPALKIQVAGKHWAPQWRVHEQEQTEQEIRYRLLDQKSGLLLTWTLTASPTTDVYTLNVGLENKGSEPIELVQWLTTLPVPSELSQITSFTGRWVHEFQPQHHSTALGALEFVNLKGRTSHDHFPGLLLSAPGSNEHQGNVLACHLGWSGNHRQRVEKSQNGLIQYQAGVQLAPGELMLESGDCYEMAPLYMTYSSEGQSGIAEHFQNFVRKEILNFPKDKPRPVHINTWEALYFDHSQPELDRLAESAKDIGAERFVLDDGWFVGRRNDAAGLGDWEVDKDVYPEGLTPLKATLKKHSLGFGLWFEPEMINKQSQLFEQHPEWLLQLDGLHQASGRNQWVLDITRQEVQAYLFDRISTLLSTYPIEYIKWDMNRDLLQAGNDSGRAVYFHYVKSLYQLLDKIRKAHPHVEIESCASGGGRMDYGILKYTHRFWLSDCNDAYERQIMQRWASLFFPAEVLGSHIGPDTSHTTSRTHPLYVRAATALFGHFGIEWDVRHLTELEQQKLKAFVALYKDKRDLIHSGIRYPLAAPDSHQLAFYVKEKNNILVSLFQQKMPQLAVPGKLKLAKLETDAIYQLEVLVKPENTEHLMKQMPAWMNNADAQFSGAALMNFGLPLPVLDPESVIILQLTKAN